MHPSESKTIRGDLAILVSTCERYFPVAQLTLRQIEAFWNPRPPLFFCGVNAEGSLPLKDDPRDWMAVTASAVRELAEQGFRWVYLILDDHPPMGHCQPEILNDLLPTWVEKLDATNIGLLGWGQRRDREGTSLGPQYAHLVNNAITYRWKFSLHPGLWSVARLEELLATRMSQFSGRDRNPWNFERHRDTAGGPLRQKLLESTYRISGFGLSGHSHRLMLATKEAGLWGFDFWRFFIRVGRGNDARKHFDEKGLWLYHVYHGPYPIFWSGAIRGGRPSPEFQTYQKLLARRWMLPGWSEIDRVFSNI